MAARAQAVDHRCEDGRMETSANGYKIKLYKNDKK